MPMSEPSVFPAFVFEWLAAFLNEIEGGKPWPDAFNHGRAAFLSKAEGGSLNPLEHRVLLMLPSVYRLWGKTRLRHLEPWIAEWTVDELYAGVGRQGAEDASYATAVLLENLQLKMST